MSEIQEYLKWKDFLHQYSVDKFKIKTYKFYFDAMYRGRAWDKSLETAFLEFNNVKRIHAPNKKLVNMGRCNLKSQPILYLSSKMKSIPLEINLVKGSLFCVAKFESIKKHFEIGPYAVTGQDRLKENPILTEILANYASWIFW